MALWLCTDCSAAYAVGQPACPNCGSTVYLEDHPMPKISVHGGATNATDEPEPVHTEPTTPEEEPSPGSNSETSSSKASSSPKTSGSAARSRARTTENPS